MQQEGEAMGWRIIIRFYKQIGTWMFTLARESEEGILEYYPDYWESKDEAAAELRRLEGV